MLTHLFYIDKIDCGREVLQQISCVTLESVKLIRELEEKNVNYNLLIDVN